MHERSLVQALLRQLEALRESHSAERILAVRITVGEFSGVDLELVRIAFVELTASPTIEGAEIQIDRVPLECMCLECGSVTLVKNFLFECGRCLSRQLKVIRGEEMVLESVTLAGGDDE